MTLKILIIISIVLQLIAVIMAIRLIRVTKYNVAWILISLALCIMSVIRFGEYVHAAGGRELRVPADFFVWLGVATSLCLVIGVFYIGKIFRYIGSMEHKRRIMEKRILNTVLRTEEKERMRFSKELHDGLGPLLSSAKMSLSALDKAKTDGERYKLAEGAERVIEEAIRSLREISNNLSPHILNDFGLARGIANFIGKIDKRDMTIDYDTNLTDERFDSDVEVIIYRVACELINNSLKHSGGTLITLKLRYEDGVLMLNYSDNGKGFNPAAMMEVGMGLSNIASRISSLKGECELHSMPGAGMSARITVDIATNERERKTQDFYR